ncbi:hypothetical protein BH18PSE1_BH18PSE1_08740 [soil metagenome]
MRGSRLRKIFYPRAYYPLSLRCRPIDNLYKGNNEGNKGPGSIYCHPLTDEEITIKPEPATVKVKAQALKSLKEVVV